VSQRQLRLRQLADQAVRDIVELDAQVAAGEIAEDAARPLRRRYESMAGRALEALDAESAEAPEPARPARARSLPWMMAYALAGVGLVVAVVLLPNSVVERPAGGFVTGNEAVQGVAGDPSLGVSDEQLEQVVAANPEVVGMRLALADRYVAQGEYGRAMRHYLEALRREPDNAEGLAGLSWLLLQVGQPEEALNAVDEALAIDPSSERALWSKANVQLYGLNDPAAARATLQELGARDLTPEVRDQVDQLMAAAEQGSPGAPG
jgi:tetratricopeptide (TPR) repeat protein